MMQPSRLALRAAAVSIATLLAAGAPAAHAADPIPAAQSANIAPAAAAAARAVVDGFHAVLLDAMKNAKKLGIKGRYALLQPELARRFDLRLMAAIASGPAWPKASAAERAKLIDAFDKFSVATYAAQFDSFNGQSFEVVSVAPGPRGIMMVNTRINQPNDSPVKLAYVTKQNDSGWQIVDVLIDDGISQLAVRRSEYSSVLGQRGIPGLVSELDSKTEKLLNP